MATTTNYGFEIPDDTDLVKDGALAMRDLGQDVDTTLATALNANDYAGLVLVKKQTVGTGVSSVTVTGAFSAAYENYRVIYSGGAASGSGEFNLTLGGITTGYTSSLIYAPGATALAAISSNTSSWFWAGGTNSTVAEATIEITSPFASKLKTFKSGLRLASFGTSTGFCNSTSSATAFTMTPSVGTLTGGTIYVYGYGIS
jgi:hypothetical protein